MTGHWLAAVVAGTPRVGGGIYMEGVACRNACMQSLLLVLLVLHCPLVLDGVGEVSGWSRGILSSSCCCLVFWGESFSLECFLGIERGGGALRCKGREKVHSWTFCGDGFSDFLVFVLFLVVFCARLCFMLLKLLVFQPNGPSLWRREYESEIVNVHVALGPIHMHIVFFPILDIHVDGAVIRLPVHVDGAVIRFPVHVDGAVIRFPVHGNGFDGGDDGWCGVSNQRRAGTCGCREGRDGSSCGGTEVVNHGGKVLLLQKGRSIRKVLCAFGSGQESDGLLEEQQVNLESGC